MLGAEIFDEVGVDARLHVVDVDTGREVGTGADEQVVIASVFKILVGLEFARQAVAGQVDPTERILVRPPGRRSTHCAECDQRLSRRPGRPSGQDRYATGYGGCDLVVLDARCRRWLSSAP